MGKDRIFLECRKWKGFNRNSVDRELQRYLWDNIMPQYQLNDPSHQMPHIMYVGKRAFKFAAEQFTGINRCMLFAAVMYHDLGSHIDRKNHHVVSAQLFLEDSFMMRYFDPSERQTIAIAIEDHRCSSPRSMPRNTYGKILSSADRYTSVDEYLRACRNGQARVNFTPKSLISEIDRAYEICYERYGEHKIPKTFVNDPDFDKFIEDMRLLLCDYDAFADRYMLANNI
ncbi:MAG: hypothetical protein Q4C83_03335, partial [Candidatus Saccharibacteria bacterium]|nr:hypothetical protein [Candidatus Saccharibacteria bacterium]